MIRPEVRALLELGRLPGDDDDETPLEPFAAALDGLTFALTDEEATALLDIFPEDKSTCAGLAWSVLHAIESAPYGSAFLASLDERSWWVVYLRQRAERGGLL